MEDITWACLVRIKTEEGYRSHLIEKPSFTIGRTQDADLPLIQQGVSRNHLVVEVKLDKIIITDRGSANGTFVNESRLKPNLSVEVSSTDVVKLGQTGNQFSFCATPKPFEFLDIEKQRGHLRASLDKVARDFEVKAREELERELQHERAESEKVVSKIRMELELLKTQEKAEVLSRKHALEDEIAKIRQSAQLAATDEKLKAAKEADLLIAQAQDRIQRELEEVGVRAEAILKETRSQTTREIADAEKKARAVLAEAREESGRIRNEASERAHALQREAGRKRDEMLMELLQENQSARQKFEEELAEKKKAWIADTRRECETERERWMKEHFNEKETLGDEVRTLREEKSAELARLNLEYTKIKAQVGELTQEKQKLDAECRSFGDELTKARELLSKTEEAEKRRETAERLYKEFTVSRERGIARLDQELKDLRDKGTVEIEEKKRQQENELAKARLKAIEDAREYLVNEEKKYDETRRLRAMELQQALSERLLSKLSNWLSAPETAPVQLKLGIESVVQEIMLNAKTTIQAQGVVDFSPTAAVERASKSKRRARLAMAAMAGIIGLLTIFRHEVWKYFDVDQKNSFASTFLEKRRIQSLYSPEQKSEFRETYTDNILYMRGYFELKTDPATIEKWTLKLNDLTLLRSMGLGEEDVVRYVALETNLVQRLGTLRNSIDAVYLSEGLDRMRKAEDEGVGEITAALKTAANFKKIRAIEKSFIEGLKSASH